MIEAMKYKKVYEQLKKDIEEAELKKKECVKNLSRLEEDIATLEELIAPFKRYLDLKEGVVQSGFVTGSLNAIPFSIDEQREHR